MRQAVLYDLTLFEDDGETPWFGAVDVHGQVIEPCFQTPDPDTPHPRPYLYPPGNSTPSEIDPATGSSRTGACTIRLLDKRLDPADQRTGIVTSRLGSSAGKRALLRRLVAGEWQVEIDGCIVGVGIDPEQLLVYELQLRDPREWERASPLFFSNHVLAGRDGVAGPPVDYGALPGGGYLLEAVPGFLSTDSSGQAFGWAHFHLTLAPAPETPYTPAVWGMGVVSLPHSLVLGLGDLGWPTQDSDGTWRYKDVAVQWRAAGSSDAWTTLRDMPALFYGFVHNRPNNTLPGFTMGPPSLHLGGYDGELPAEGQAIELRVLAVAITEDTPFYWDGGTVGDLLTEIAAGEHTDRVPPERYDAAALAEFAASSPPARFILKQPVLDRRRWVEENIYQPALVAPALNLNGELRPVSWRTPDAETPVPVLSGSTVQPVGDFQLTTQEAVGGLSFTYIREHLDPVKQITQKRTKGHWFWKKSITELVDDPSDARSSWERLVETEVVLSEQFADGLPGAKVLTYKPTTIRSTAGVDGRPIGGDAQDELGNLVYQHIRSELRARFLRGAVRLQADVIATVATLQRTVGDFVRARLDWLPDVGTGVRQLRRLMQVVAVANAGPSLRRFTLLDTGVADLTADDDEEGLDPSGENCLAGLTGASLRTAPDGRALLLFREAGRHTLVNSCPDPIEVRLLLVSGGAGGTNRAGGGGGAGGGVLGGDLDGPVTVTIPGLASRVVEVGEGGLPGTPGAYGGHTILWQRRDDDSAMDPDLDDPDDGYIARNDFSGSGASLDLPGSGGGITNGDEGTPPNGNDGGAGNNQGGLATCQAAAGGGGGSYGGEGGDSDLSVDPAGSGAGGQGGPSYTIAEFGITVGGGGGGGARAVNASLPPGECRQLSTNGVLGESGYGRGGAGGGGVTPLATSGGTGVAAFMYSGPVGIPLQPPDIASTTPTDTNQAEICVDAEGWPQGADQVRVEYATGDTEPDPSSSAWRFAGTLTEPGCVFTPPLPTGARVWSRGRAEAEGSKPSVQSGTDTADTPGTAGLLALEVSIDASGVATVSWTPNAYCAAVKVRGAVHLPEELPDRPLPLLAALDADESPYVLLDVVPRGSYVTVDVECWEDYSFAVQGRTERQSTENPARQLLTALDGLDALADVAITAAAAGDILRLDEYGEWVNTEPKLDSFAEPDDTTELDATTARHGLLRKLDGEEGHFLNGQGQWVAPAGGEWTEIVAVANQDVVNSSTMAADTELFFSVVAGGIYNVELMLLYGGSDASVDLQYTFTFPTSEIVYEARSFINAASGFQSLTPARSGFAATDLGTQVELGTSAVGLTEVRYARFWAELRVASAGTFQFKFANLSPAVGRTSRRFAGSILRYRRVF